MLACLGQEDRPVWQALGRIARHDCGRRCAVIMAFMRASAISWEEQSDKNGSCRCHGAPAPACQGSAQHKACGKRPAGNPERREMGVRVAEGRGTLQRADQQVVAHRPRDCKDKLQRARACQFGGYELEQPCADRARNHILSPDRDADRGIAHGFIGCKLVQMNRQCVAAQDCNELIGVRLQRNTRHSCCRRLCLRRAMIVALMGIGRKACEKEGSDEDKAAQATRRKIRHDNPE